MERGELDHARKQIDEGLTLRPGDPKLSAILVRLLLLQKQPQEALSVLQKQQSGSMPEWQCNLLRARALIDLERWDEARAAAPLATKLNPEPAEAHYVWGLIQQHDGKWQEAAEEFRKAYESVAQQRR
jgi:Flp pilus assembly protein TadD